MSAEMRRDRMWRVALVLLALLTAYGIWAGLGAWTAQQTGWKPLPGLSPLPTGTPAPTATPGWWDSPIEVPAWEGGQLLGGDLCYAGWLTRQLSLRHDYGLLFQQSV